jgi:hypothetical protein
MNGAAICATVWQVMGLNQYNQAVMQNTYQLLQRFVFFAGIVNG